MLPTDTLKQGDNEMSDIALDEQSRVSISALVEESATVGRRVKRASGIAAKELKLREQVQEARHREQEGYEKQLDAIISHALSGVSVLHEFAQLPEIQQLVSSRKAVDKETLIYEAHNSESDTTVEVILKIDAIEVVISGTRASMVQGIDKPTNFTECVLRWSFPLAGEDPIHTKWLLELFRCDLYREWAEWEFERDSLAEKRSPIARYAILDFENTDAMLAARGKWKDHGWWATHVLIRFLSDCANSGMLKSYLDLALRRLRRI